MARSAPQRETRDVIDGYVSGPDAATEPRRRALAEITAASRVLLVEGITDQIAVETVAARAGRDLAADGVVVAPMGGAHAIDTFLGALDRADAPHVDVRGLCDRREAPVFRAALARAGFGPLTTQSDMERIGFFVCDADLEAELIRSVGADPILDLLGQHGDIDSFRTMQKQSAWRTRPVEAQLHRFFRSKARRMHRYARLLVEAVDLDCTPRPLLGVVGLL